MNTTLNLKRNMDKVRINFKTRSCNSLKTFRSTKKQKKPSSKYIRRTRTIKKKQIKPFRSSVSIYSEKPTDNTISLKDSVNASETFEFMDELDLFNSPDENMAYDLPNIFSPVSHSIFGDEPQIADLSEIARRGSTCGKLSSFDDMTLDSLNSDC